MAEDEPYDPYPDRDTRLRYMVGLAAMVALIMVIGVLSSQVGLWGILATIAAAAFFVTFVYIVGRWLLTGRWVLPVGERLEKLVTRRRATGSPDGLHRFTPIRYRMLMGLAGGIIVGALVGVAVGSLWKLVAFGFVLGLGNVLIWSAIWMVRRD